MRALLLGLLVVGKVLGSGDFSFDVTSAADDNWVKIPTTTAHRMTTLYAVDGWQKTSSLGVNQTMHARRLFATNANWALYTTTAEKGGNLCSAGGVSGSGANVVGATNATGAGWQHLLSTFDSSASAVIYLDGVSDGTDSTVAATDDPNTGIRIGGSADASDLNGAALDARGSLGPSNVYSILPTAGERLQLAAVNSLRRPFRGRVGYWQLLGQPGTNMGTVVPDWSPQKAHGDGSAGTDPTYIPMMQRGAGR